jgi:hypothetical protein
MRCKFAYPLVIPKPALLARNLLIASSETANSSRYKAALRNDNPSGISFFHRAQPDAFFQPLFPFFPAYWAEQTVVWHAQSSVPDIRE